MNRVLALLREHGRETISFQTLEPELRHWFPDGNESADACVAYLDVSTALVAAGGPIGPLSRRADVMKKFCRDAKLLGRRARFFAIEDDNLGPEFSTIAIGHQPIWDPADWPGVLAEKRSLREQLRRARAKSVRVRTVSPKELAEESPLRQSMDALVARWRASRSLPPMGFLVHLDLYGHAEERRYVVAERAGAICAFLIAVPVYARKGWFFEDVLRDPDAPNGTVELLIDAAMTMADAEGSHWVSYGMAPLANVESRPLCAIRDSTRWLYNFQGVYAFKAKLGPKAWQKVYLAYPAQERGVLAIIDTLRAFARGSLLRFAGATLIHRAPLVAWLLAMFLLPWTALLAAAPTETWFPSPNIKAAWLAYDHLLFAGLVTLAYRWWGPLAIGLALAEAADFSLGVIQALTFNAARAHGAIEWGVIVLSLIAPALACVFLVVARNHARVDQPRKAGSGISGSASDTR